MTESGPASAETAGGDQMECRSCGVEQRASEGYPCAGCGTFICLVCEMRGVVHCRACADVLLPPPLSLRPPE